MVENIEELRKTNRLQVENANKYAKARYLAGKAECDLKIILAANLNELQGNRKTLGVEMALLKLVSKNDVAKEIFIEWKYNESIYLGLEKVLDSLSSTVITETSLLKYLGTGERLG